MKNETANTALNVEWECQNIIIVDADYVDKVTFEHIVNFERMLMRRVPQADFARWIDCVALDGGMRPTAGQQPASTQVVLIHRKDSSRLENFLPSDYATELDGKAFKDNLGEFSILALPIEDMVDLTSFFLDILGTVCARQEVKRVMVISNAEEDGLYDHIRETLRHVDDSKRITVFTMQSMPGGNFRQEYLGYSLTNALGIRADEIK